MTSIISADEQINGRTQAEWEALAQIEDAAAKGNAREAAESWERSDTDGFMSQWASGIMSREHMLRADLYRAHGLMTTRALFNLDGTIASTHNPDGQYGEYWVLNDASADLFGRRFVSVSNASTAAKRDKANRKKGFTVGSVRVAGYVTCKGGSLTSVSAGTFPSVGALRAGEYEIIETDSTATDTAVEAMDALRNAELATR